MRVVVVEDEAPAREKLLAAIRAAAPDARIEAALSSVAEAVDWLERNGSPDLLFLDIQLSDGVSFEILRRARVTCPVIFATAFDEYLLEAFESNGIDYLLKPVRQERLAAALAKYRSLGEHFRADHTRIFDALVGGRSVYRERFLVRKGPDLGTVNAADVAYIFTEGKLVFLVTQAGARYLLDSSLAELEAGLDPARFFRANRAWLVAIHAVRRCRPYGKGKLLVEVQPPAHEEVIVSQERAGALRRWLAGEP